MDEGRVSENREVVGPRLQQFEVTPLHQSAECDLAELRPEHQSHLNLRKVFQEIVGRKAATRCRLPLNVRSAKVSR